MRLTATVAAVLLVSAFEAGAATLVAASCSANDVQTALTAAAAGDTVTIPAGTCHWTTGGLYWSAPANVTVLGAGNLSTLGGGDATVIVDDFAGTAPLMQLVTHATGSFRFAGLTFRGGSGGIKESGIIAVQGLSKSLRIDHIHLDMQSYVAQNASKPMTIGGWTNGVIDHIVVDLMRQGHIQFSAATYGTGVPNDGDEAFAAPTGFGTSDFIFMESSQFNAHEDPGTPGLFLGTTTDCNGGGRMVLRYNTIVGAGFAQTHPTGGGQGGRGCRAHEVYGNTGSPSSDFDPLVDAPPFVFSWMSSGTSMVWGNVVNGVNKHFIYMDSMRKNNNTYAQTPTPNGWGYCGTQFTGTGSAWDGNTDSVSGYPCLDQPGRGRSDLLTGGNFPNRINSTTGTISWPHQALEPVREWLNTFTAVPGWGNDGNARMSRAAGTDARLLENRDYYSFTSSFDGTVGNGVGPRASRPATCTAGVAYWSTDQGGNWNTSNGSSHDGTLDVCTSTDTWTNSFYTPYPYPHPLTGPAQTAPAAPTNLRITG